MMLGMFFRNWRLRSSVRYARDVCLLPSHNFQFYEATPWQRAYLTAPDARTEFPDGSFVTVVQTPLFSWIRAFSYTGAEPPFPVTKSRIQIHEWIPSRFPRERAGWAHLAHAVFHAIYWLSGDVHPIWDGQMRRHLREFSKTPHVRIRLGTFEDIERHYHRSQVPVHLQPVYLDSLRKMIAVHPEDVEILVAELAGEMLGAIVVGNDFALRRSFYFLGFFVPGSERMHPVAGLMDAWIRRSKERGFVVCDFGHMCGPRPTILHDGLGYSAFKIRCGVQRVWAPGSFWRIRFQS